MNRNEYAVAHAQYIQSLPSKKKASNTLSTYDLALRKFADFLKRTEQQGDITPIDIVNFRTDLFASGIKTNTIRQYLINLHTFFGWCCRMKKVKENPVMVEELPKSERIEYDLLDNEQIDKALTVTPSGIFSKTAPRNRALIVLLLQTGMRSSEIRALKPSDLDFDGCTIKVRHGKGDKYREVAFPSLSRQLVEEYLNSGIRPLHLTDNDWLFGNDTDEHGHSTNGNIWHQFSSCGLLQLTRRYIAHCTGKDNGVGVHSLRHSFTALADDAGVPIRVVQQALGHSSVQLTENTYSYILRRSKNAETINEAFDRQFATI